MNIKEIAKMARVSPATVSRVLNNPMIVEEKTRKKVLKVIEDSNYVPNAMARSLSTNTSCTIGVAFPDIENQFFSSLLRGITHKASEYGYNVFFYDTDEDVAKEHNFLMTVKEHRFKGIIISPVTEQNEVSVKELIDLEKTGVPVILVDRDITNVQFDGVFFQDDIGSCDAVRCLVEAGHTDIAIVTGPQSLLPGRERLAGYKRALEEKKIPIQDRYIINGNFRSDIAYEATKHLMEQKNPPTAIFASNNLTTLGCLRYFREHKIEVGRDIGFVGYDDIEELSYAGYNITCVERPTINMGKEAMNLINMRFLESDSSSKIHKRSIIGTNLIVRGSEKIQER